MPSSPPDRPMNDLEALTEVLAERSREHAGPDPDPEELLDYLEGRLSADEDEAMRGRLVASPSASRRLLDLADLTEAGAAAEAVDPEAPADLAVHAGWRDLQRRLPKRQTGSDRREGGHPPHGGLVALVATLAVAVLALGTWVWRLESASGAGGEALVANLKSLELFEPVRSGDVPAVEVAPGEPFRIALYPPERCPSYQAEIVGPRAGQRRTVTGLKPDELGLLVFLFGGEPGGYSLRLSGCERELSTYDFEISPPGDATSGGNAP